LLQARFFLEVHDDASPDNKVHQCIAQASLHLLCLIALFTNPVDKSLQICQSKMMQMAANRFINILLIFMLTYLQSCNGIEPACIKELPWPRFQGKCG